VFLHFVNNGYLPYLLTYLNPEPISDYGSMQCLSVDLSCSDEVGAVERERVELRRDYDQLVAELTSALHVDQKTVSPNTLRHKVGYIQVLHRSPLIV